MNQNQQYELYNELERLDDEFWNLMNDRVNARDEQDLLIIKNRQDRLQSWIESSVELKKAGIEMDQIFLSKDMTDFDSQSNLIFDFLNAAIKKVKATEFLCSYEGLLKQCFC